MYALVFEHSTYSNHGHGQHNKSPAQVLVRWSLQRGCVSLLQSRCALPDRISRFLHRFAPLPKSADPVRVAGNADVYDFELSLQDMAAIDALDCGKEGAITWNPVDVD